MLLYTFSPLIAEPAGILEPLIPIFIFFGTLELIVELMPNCPEVLDPQQYALLSEAITHAWLVPTEIFVILAPLGISEPEVPIFTCFGMFWSAVLPMPSWPYALLPQQ